MNLPSLLLIAGKAGLQLLGRGVDGFLRLSREAALVVTQGGGSLQEASDQGRLFYGATAKTGVAPGTDIGTTAAFCLANPVDSGVTLVLRKVSIGYVSGTLGAGFVGACYGGQSFTAVTGTAITPVGGKDGGSSAKGKAFTTATIPATPSLMQPIWNAGAALASTALGLSVSEWEPAGGIQIPPGRNFSLQGVAAAGTSPLVVFGAVWEEVPAA